ncbi:hypothetical protein NWT39_13220 [Nitrososphaera viennensis]|uniref:Uncharacterized protein n=3 Tax=Nitrososphaera viennensis TaxID=1034015 RepID=A0A060HV96_9ARCH|nr:hypothetical protein [Nitrososphaera viennensis]AIC16952.1 hypothetical protein NVIE_026800 [Nitrososphaera viennensis EN76]UVS68855.1 hypothetical protein NWT39_13220 [Nitrososphaera viennensis]CBX88962.1 hypothetical protein [Nitrososphaera phage Pro-Nvie1]
MAAIESSLEAFYASLIEENEKRIMEHMKQDSFDLCGKTFRYRKITTAQHLELDRMQAGIEDLVLAKGATKLEITAKLAEIYQKRAQYHLGMDADTFYSLPWEDVKPVLDACVRRTRRGHPL